MAVATIRVRGIATAVEPIVIHGHGCAAVKPRGGAQRDQVWGQGEHALTGWSRCRPPSAVREAAAQTAAQTAVLHVRHQHGVLRHHRVRETALRNRIRRHKLREALPRGSIVDVGPSVGSRHGMACREVKGRMDVLQCRVHQWLPGHVR